MATDVTAVEDEEYVDGFSWKTVIGALFIGFIMMPGSIYLGLIAGQGMGPAAEWVTIILFMEVARRSYQTLKKQEIYLLYYIGAALTTQVAGVALAGGPFAGADLELLRRAHAHRAGVGHHGGRFRRGLRPHRDSPGFAGPHLFQRRLAARHWTC